MMNHCVPNFDMEDDCRFPSSSSASPAFRSRKASMQQDEVMELLWENGQVVMHRPTKQQVTHQLQTVNTGSSSGGGGKEPAVADAPPLYIQEDEMASWLQYPIDGDPQFDRDFCSELLFPAASCTGTSVTDPIPETRPQPPIPAKPPIPPERTSEEEVRARGFGHFSRFRPRIDAGSPVEKAGKKSLSETVVESSATPMAVPMESKASHATAAGEHGRSSVGRGMETTSLDFTVDSSSGASGAEPGLKPSASGDKKRQVREADDSECRSQDVVLKAADAKKRSHGSNAKRTRAAEVHNLSERRRRDRINEKMKALQELVPRCNKSDKASMLDDAIEYLKSLQMQVQMMSMGCGMVPMMFPGMQQYMQPMGMGVGMGVDVNRPMMPFPMATPALVGPRLPMPPYHPIPPFVAPDSSRTQVNNPTSMLNPAGIPNAYQVQTIPDQYHQYPGCQAMRPPQNEAMVQPNASKPSPGGGPENPGPGPESGTATNYLSTDLASQSEIQAEQSWIKRYIIPTFIYKSGKRHLSS